MPSAYHRKLAEAQKPKENDEEFGTKASGFAEGGPFSCMNCVHMQHVNNEDVCVHPTVKSDPDLAHLLTPEGNIKVDYDDCCRFVRPAEDKDEDE